MGDEIARVEDRLRELGENWAWLARELGLSQQVLGNWRNRPGGRRQVPRDHLLGVARALRVSVDWLMTGASDVERLTEAERRHLELYRAACPETRAVVDRVLKADTR